MQFRVFVDFDGTIAIPDTTDVILERFALPEWRQIEALWQTGQMGSKECMARQVALIRADERALDGLIDEVQVDADFQGFVADCRSQNISLHIVSDGLDRVVQKVLARIGLGDIPVAANRLLYSGDLKWTLVAPFSSPSCHAKSGTCKCAVAARSASDDIRVLIGDGRSDQCLAEEADFVFAKAGLIEFCRQNGVAHRAVRGFDDVRAHFGELHTLPFALTGASENAALS